MPDSSERETYLLGTNQQEFERLQFQHGVWGPVTHKFFDRLNVQKGWRCLDVGAGPGLVSMDLRKLVGETGEVTALDPSQFYLDLFKAMASDKGWANVNCVLGTAENAALPSRYYDLIFVRWVVAFVADPEQFLLPLFKALRTGGVIAIQDYYYEGLSLFPRGGVWDTMPDIVRAYYRSGGGDAYVTGKLPSIFRRHGLNMIDFTPNCLSGGPNSSVMEWAHRFFSLHTPLMAEKGVISREQADALMADWNSHRRNPDTLFFSPLVVDVAGIARR
jgi:ubiquinone/menaquinone biosynthesis C-methylase UbiE